METIAPHALEPEIASPPPRAITLRWKTSALLGAAGLLFALVFYGGARALAEAARLGWLSATGQTVRATVDGIDTAPATTLHYHYRLPFAPGAGAGQVRLGNSQSAPPFHIGETFPLRCARWRGQTIAVPWPPRTGQKIAFLTLCGALLLVFSAAMAWRLLAWRQARVRLLRGGLASVGTIVDKRVETEDTLRYFVRYGYGRAENTPPMCEHEEQVTAEQWKRLDIGQSVTVLYDPAHRKRAGLYVLLSER